MFSKPIFKAIALSAILVAVAANCMSASSKDLAKPGLALKASLETKQINIGGQINATVSLVNVSNKPVKVNYMHPQTVIPEIWDAASNKLIPNAPTHIQDMIVTPKEVLLAPNQQLALSAPPISLPNSKSGSFGRPFWQASPGAFKLRYSVPLASFVAGGEGTLTASDLSFTLVDPMAERKGEITFEDGKGFFIIVEQKGAKEKERIYLQTGDDREILDMDKDTGGQVKITGLLQRMTDHKGPGIPSGALYFSKFKVEFLGPTITH